MTILAKPKTEIDMNSKKAVTPRFEIVTVTPELAKEWLEANTHNREIKWRTVKEISGAIKRGEWVLNGATITFDINGVLVDGQNRCLAIMDAGISVPSLVGYGLEPKAQRTVDIGSKRTFGDTLKMEGEHDPNHLATITRYAFLYERYVMSNAPMDSRVNRPTLIQLLDYFNNHRSRILAALLGGSHASRRLHAGNKSMLSVAWFIFHEINPEDCRDFFNKLGSGVDQEGKGISSDNPIYVLRRWMTNNYDRRDKARPEVVLAVVIKTWNAYREGFKIENLMWVGGGSNPHPFPKVK